MFKKIVLTTILLLTIGVLVFGAINRTQAKTESEVAGRQDPGEVWKQASQPQPQRTVLPFHRMPVMAIKAAEMPPDTHPVNTLPCRRLFQVT